VKEREIDLGADGIHLAGTLALPGRVRGAVLFAHGSGASRRSPRNRAVTATLNEAGFATLLLDLLTPREENVDRQTAHLRFDIPLLAGRVIAAADWLATEADTRDVGLGLFGASTGAAAALIAAAQRPGLVRAVVSRGGRPDLAGRFLPGVSAPTLLIVGGHDPVVLDMNRQALARLPGDALLEVVAGATHLFEEPGALETVAALARRWFERHLSRASGRAVA